MISATKYLRQYIIDIASCINHSFVGTNFYSGYIFSRYEICSGLTSGRRKRE
jgi:hypothetical protein